MPDPFNPLKPTRTVITGIPPRVSQPRRAPGISLLLILAASIVLTYGLSRLAIIPWPQQLDPLALPDLSKRPGFLTRFQLSRLENDLDGCRRIIGAEGLDNRIQPVAAPKVRCAVSDAVQLNALSLARLKPEETRCSIVARLYMWERHVVQSAALRLLKEPVIEILHFGSYSCRTIAGSHRMSQHARANAFDISGFRLKSGKIISIKLDWPGNTPQAKFLRTVRDGACDYFNLVLSPDYNNAHADHFHVDMGRWQSCR
jgi:hypothetical protein